MLGLALLQLHRFEEARDHLAMGMGDPSDPPIIDVAPSITRALAALGEEDEARSVVEASRGWSLRAQMRSYGGIQDLERTFSVIDTALTLNAPWLVDITRDPFFDFLREDPRYARLVQVMGLER
jgi:hypothetical protein